MTVSISNRLNQKMFRSPPKFSQVTKRACLHWLLFLFMLVGVGCTTPGPAQPTPTPIGSLTVDPVFREFYRHLGGEEILGPPIGAAYTEGAARIQFVQKAKMVFDPSRSIRQRFTLAPLGVEMGVIEPPVLPPDEPGFKYDGGHVISPEFIPLYEKLGAFVVGKPLREVRYNSVRRRYEQFFESVGFYRLEGSPLVQLLDYGIWACNGNCSPEVVALASPDATIDLITRIDPVFVQFVNQLGADFTGFAISEPYVNNEGNWEQIFENVVLQANSPDDPTSVNLRPLYQRLNIPSDPPQEDDAQPDQHFYPQDGTRGYQIPDYFWEYLESHGGLKISGPPITQQAPLNNGAALHQCFENLCLVYDPQAPPPGRVRPEQIGHAYKTLYHSSDETAKKLPPALQITVWERYPYISPGQEQEVGVSVVQNNLPVAGIQPTLVVTQLDGSEMAVPLPVTDANGHSSLRLGPLQGPSGSLIQYKICLPIPEEQESCKEESFVLWNTP